MRNVRRLLATAIAVIGLSFAAVPAYSAPFSYYELVSNMQGDAQTNFAKTMLRSYESGYATLKPMAEKYGHYPWAANLVETTNFYENEIARYQALLGGVATIAEITATHQTFKYNETQQVTETPEVASRSSSQDEVTEDYTVNVYEDVVITHTKTVTTKTYKGTFTTQWYSDNSNETSVSTELVSTVVEDVTRTETERNFVKTYELERPVEVVVVVVEEPVVVVEEPVVVVEEPVVVVNVNEGMGVVTENVFTVEEYLAMSDVNLSTTQTYIDAVHTMNPNINLDYITRESGLYNNGKVLETIKAPHAWAKGWTGKGSVLAILDTGIDMDHSEFEGKILDTKCFTATCADGSETIQDLNKYSHGTHVAGIAAANLDGNGTTGVAPDAKLLIGKVAYDNGYFGLRSLGEGIEWAVNNGADAVNVSGNYNVDRTYKDSIVSNNNGGFYATDTRYDGVYQTNGYSYLANDADYMLPQITNAMNGNETVVVFAAGNQRMDVPTYPAHYAVAENEDGDLLLGGKAIIVGSWDLKTDKISNSSNRAGTMCYGANGECATDRKVSDWYIMAPGRYVAAPDANGGYRTNSGTSMAAPAVTGAVGIVHQMWPYMKGENIVQLLLTTANKDLTNYDVNLHGQGMLDLDAATNPVGAVGIPTTGRIEGARSNLDSGAFAMSGGAYIGSISSLTVVDAFDRNFTIDGNNMVGVADTRSADPTQSAVRGFAPDYYFGYGNGQVIPMEHGALNINERSIAIAGTVDQFMFGMVSEDGSFLGNVANNPLMDVNGANTFYAGYNLDKALTDDVTLFGNAILGVTKLNVGSSMMSGASELLSNSATLGIKRNVDNGDFGFVASVPVAITNGTATFRTASTVSATGDVDYLTSSSDLSATKREVDLGVFRNFAVTDNLFIKAHAEARLNYAGTNETVTSAGINLTWSF
jgi:subtilisin family serine protease|tara:strand:+ start:11608 stop:14397 length:2790 start_codon:yes stop_codon:yes gene_type:complete